MSDSESAMVMMPSDSMTSMGSEMVRMDSTAQLSQTSSFQSLQGEVNGKAAINSASKKLQGVEAVAERDNESDEDSHPVQ